LRRILTESDDLGANPQSDDDSPTNTEPDPLVRYRDEADSEADVAASSWQTPFLRPQRIHPADLAAECAELAPGFDPAVLAARESFGPITTLDDLKRLEDGQRVLVVAPRFGLGNTLRNWVSAYMWALISGRRIVILHAGKFHGVLASTCEAFKCDFDHIYPKKLLDSRVRGGEGSSRRKLAANRGEGRVGGSREGSDTDGDRSEPESEPGTEPGGHARRQLGLHRRKGRRSKGQPGWQAYEWDSEDAATDPDAMLYEFESNVTFATVTHPTARAALQWTDKIVFAFSYAFWDHWWLNDRRLSQCACRALNLGSSSPDFPERVSCRPAAGGGYRSAALHALLAGGPTLALSQTIQNILRRHEPDPDRLKLPLSPADVAAADSPLEMEFDVGLHIRTRTAVLERPDRLFAECEGTARGGGGGEGGGREEGESKEECERRQVEKEREKHRALYLNPLTWKCVGRLLTELGEQARIRKEEGRSGRDGEEGAEDDAKGKAKQGRALSIFLATDNEALRPEMVTRLAPYGVVYYNGAEVAHVGVSTDKHTGRLPTMAEFYLLGKSHVIVELDSYLSTFSYFAGLFGNGTIVSVPYKVTSINRCSHVRPAQKGSWRRGDSRGQSNNYFFTDQ
ncbi:hypothetical protein CLOM_g1004, partial [Closterium sp. NIES-68]